MSKDNKRTRKGEVRRFDPEADEATWVGSETHREVSEAPAISDRALSKLRLRALSWLRILQVMTGAVMLVVVGCVAASWITEGFGKFVIGATLLNAAAWSIIIEFAFQRR